LPHREIPSNGYAAILYVLLKVCTQTERERPENVCPREKERREMRTKENEEMRKRGRKK
jgi:hypothetical protein